MSAAVDAVEHSAPLPAPGLNLEEAAATAELLRALADPTRVRIVNVLAIVDQPVCASNLCEPLGLAQPPVSHHVKELMATTANELREEVRRR